MQLRGGGMPMLCGWLCVHTALINLLLRRASLAVLSCAWWSGAAVSLGHLPARLQECVRRTWCRRSRPGGAAAWQAL